MANNHTGKNRESRKDAQLAAAIADGTIARVQAEAEASPFAHNVATDSDRANSIAQAHLEFITHLVNDGVKHEGVTWLKDDNDYVTTLLNLAKLKGLKVTEQNIINRFTNAGAVNIEAETENNTVDAIDLMNDTTNAPLLDSVLRGRNG